MPKLITPQECLVCAGAPDLVQSLNCLLTSLLKSFPRSLLESSLGLLARYCNHQEIMSRRLEQKYTSSDTGLEWPGEGPLFESGPDKRRGSKTGSLFESLPRPLLKSGLQPLGRYGTHQATIRRKPGQMYAPFEICT